MEKLFEKLKELKEKAKGMEKHVALHVTEMCEGLKKQDQKLVFEDLTEDTLKSIEKKIAAAARANGGGLCGKEADEIVKKHFGINDKPKKADEQKVNLLDFL